MFVLTSACWYMLMAQMWHGAKKTWSSYMYRNMVVITKATEYHDDGEAQIDVTEGYKHHFRFNQRIEVPNKASWVEVRYELNGKKYRIVHDKQICLPYTMGSYLRQIVKAVVLDTGEDVTERIQKFAGPNGDFHGVEDLPMRWVFPNRDDDDIPGEVRIEYKQVNVYNADQAIRSVCM